MTRCRIYDTECINASYCDEADACCAGDPACQPDPLATLELHRDLCRECTPFHLCHAGAKLLERMTEQLALRMAPAPVTPGSA